jgi:hypothetical protein
VDAVRRWFTRVNGEPVGSGRIRDHVFVRIEEATIAICCNTFADSENNLRDRLIFSLTMVENSEQLALMMQVVPEYATVRLRAQRVDPGPDKQCGHSSECQSQK